MNRDGKLPISETEYYLDKRKKLRRGQTFPGAETLFHYFKNSETNKANYQDII